MSESKSICVLTGDQYRAAFACRAVKDPRFYLESLFISGKHKELVATNGHILYCSPIDGMDDGHPDIIIDAAKIPANIQRVIVTTFDDSHVLVETETVSGTVGPQFICKVIDANYPDYKAVYPDISKSESFQEICFSAVYLAIIQKVFGKVAVKFTLGGLKKPSIISTKNESMGSLLLMPCRM